ncbi:MAG: SGNH/GDSL hydrolase family protein [Acidobacteriia bacterium]|nr:SGNH/GDSL hydrolase family protein [Terriglobia bacterium]
MRRSAGTALRTAILRLTAVGLLLVAGSALAPAAQVPQPQRKPLRVLFVGNSYTYYNNLPEMLEQLSLSAGTDSRIQARMIVAGGAMLEQLWQRGAALWAIQHGGWDYVVLQEQSSLGPSPMVDGLPTIRSPDDFYKYARLFDEAIRQAGAKTVFYSTWARRNAPVQNQQALDFAYMRIARELHARVAPVGLAWQDLRTKGSGVDPYWQDGSHPSPAGTYLAACVFYATFTGKNPKGLSHEIFGPPVDDTGRIDGDKKVQLVGLSAASARLIQEAAWKAHQKLESSGGYLSASPPPEPLRTALPTGRKPVPADLEGYWRGETRVFSRAVSWPAAMELHLTRAGEDLRGELKIRFGNPRDDITTQVSDVRLTETGFSFIQPQGVSDAIVKYEGVFTGRSLEGEARIVLTDGAVVGIGRWSLKRRK